MEPTVLRIGHEGHRHFLSLDPEGSGFGGDDALAMESALGSHRRETRDDGAEFYDDSTLDSLICDISQFICYYLLSRKLDEEEGGRQVRRIGELMLASIASAAVAAVDTMAVAIGDDEDDDAVED